MDWLKTVKDYYDTIVDGKRLYTNDDVKVFVVKEKITPTQYKEITGFTYVS